MGATRSSALRGQRSGDLLVPAVGLSFGAVLAVNAGRLLTRLAVVVMRHPLMAGAVVAVVLLRVVLGPARLLAFVIVLGAVLVVWRQVHQTSFTRRLSGPVRSSWRAWAVYRRRWEPVMTTTALTTTYGDAVFVPRLRRIVCGWCVDSLLVQLLAGQAPTVYEERVDELAHTFTALSCRVRLDRPGWVWLDFTHTDPLVEPVPALPVVDVPDLAALQLGVADDGTPWVLGSHVLIAGATGSGKGR